MAEEQSCSNRATSGSHGPRQDGLLQNTDRADGTWSSRSATPPLDAHCSRPGTDDDGVGSMESCGPESDRDEGAVRVHRRLDNEDDAAASCVSELDDARGVIVATMQRLRSFHTSSQQWKHTKDVCEEQLSWLSDLLLNARLPRIAVIGRRGAGKSSLINAIFGRYVAAVGSVQAKTAKAQWYKLYATGANGEQVEQPCLEVLDTLGCQQSIFESLSEDESSKPSATQAFDMLREIMTRELPDCILFVVKAKEVGAALEPDILFTEQVCTLLHEKWQVHVPVIAVVSQVDELPPRTKFDPQTYPEKKLSHIRRAVDVVQNAFARVERTVRLLCVIPTSSLMTWTESRQVDQDYRWNVDRLFHLLTERIDAKGLFALIRSARVGRAREQLANRLSDTFAGVARAIASRPIPLADIVAVTRLQLLLVRTIGRLASPADRASSISGHNERHFAYRLYASLGTRSKAKFFLQQAAAVVASLVPGVGDMIEAHIAEASTRALGRAAISFFLSDSQPGDVQMMFEEAKMSLQRDSSL